MNNKLNRFYNRYFRKSDVTYNAPEMSEEEILSVENDMRKTLKDTDATDKEVSFKKSPLSDALREMMVTIYMDAVPYKRDEMRKALGMSLGDSDTEKVSEASFSPLAESLRSLFSGLDTGLLSEVSEGEFIGPGKKEKLPPELRFSPMALFSAGKGSVELSDEGVSIGDLINIRRVQRDSDKLIDFLKEINIPRTKERDTLFKYRELI